MNKITYEREEPGNENGQCDDECRDKMNDASKLLGKFSIVGVIADTSSQTQQLNRSKTQFLAVKPTQTFQCSCAKRKAKLNSINETKVIQNSTNGIIPFVSLFVT